LACLLSVRCFCVTNALLITRNVIGLYNYCKYMISLQFGRCTTWEVVYIVWGSNITYPCDHDRNVEHKIPAAENVPSASTDVARLICWLQTTTMVSV
jgi:hypothetical protein